MDFSEALKLLKQGKKVKRKSWNKQFIYLVSGSTFTVNRKPLNEFFEEGTKVSYNSHIDACFDDGTLGVFTLSHRDIFAEDWELVK